jgi:hypothetical protein
VILAGDRGPKVLALQQALLERGMLPPGIEDEQQLAFFGPVTLGAVKTFQAKAGLVVDGVVGPRTWGALQKVGSLEKDEAQAPDYGRMSKLAARAVATADAELQRAVREHPMGSNRGHDVDGYLRGIYDDAPYLLKYAPDKAAPGGWGGAPWCGRAARWCFERGAQQLGQPSPFLSWKSDLASALKWRDAAAERGAGANTLSAYRNDLDDFGKFG